MTNSPHERSDSAAVAAVPSSAGETLSDQAPTGSTKHQTAEGSRASNRQALLIMVAGVSLLANSTYSLFFLLTTNPSPAPLVVIDKIVGFIGIFPQLLLGFALVFIALPPKAIKSEVIWNKLLRQLVALFAVAYLLCVPLSTIQEFSQIQVESSGLARANEFLQGRKQSVMTAIANLKTKQEFEDTLSQFPEIQGIRINPNEPPAATVKSIEIALDNALFLQDQSYRAELDERLNLLKIRGRLISVGSLVAGLSFLALGLVVVPWISGLGRFIASLSKELMFQIQRLFMNLPRTAKAEPTGGHQAATAKAKSAMTRRSKAIRSAVPTVRRNWSKAWTDLQKQLSKLRPGSSVKGSSRSRSRSRK